MKQKPHVIKNWIMSRIGIPYIHEIKGLLPYIMRKRTITGIENKKWTISCSTIVTGSNSLGKLTFFIRDVLERKVIGAAPNEVLNHCHGKRPDIRKRT
jgi:hypothetical protein